MSNKSQLVSKYISESWWDDDSSMVDHKVNAAAQTFFKELGKLSVGWQSTESLDGLQRAYEAHQRELLRYLGLHKGTVSKMTQGAQAAFKDMLGEVSKGLVVPSIDAPQKITPYIKSEFGEASSRARSYMTIGSTSGIFGDYSEEITGDPKDENANEELTEKWRFLASEAERFHKHMSAAFKKF